MKIKPLFDMILLKEEETNVTNGLVLPDIAKDKPNIAKIVEVGNGGRLDGNDIEIVVKVGEKVLFNKFATTEIKVDNQSLLLIKQADILAKLED